FYGRRWSGVTHALVDGNFNASTVLYRDLATDSSRWQSQYQGYDTTYKANYLSIPGMNEFDSYNGPEFIKDAVAWQRSQGFGGFMTFTMDYEFIPSQSGDAAHPLSTALAAAVFGGGSTTPPVTTPPTQPAAPAPVITSGAPTGKLAAGTTFATL